MNAISIALVAIGLALDQAREHVALRVARGLAPLGHQRAQVGQHLGHAAVAGDVLLGRGHGFERAQDGS